MQCVLFLSYVGFLSVFTAEQSILVRVSLSEAALAVAHVVIFTVRESGSHNESSGCVGVNIKSDSPIVALVLVPITRASLHCALRCSVLRPLQGFSLPLGKVKRYQGDWATLGRAQASAASPALLHNCSSSSNA